MAQLMPLLLTVSCISKIQISFTFLVPADLGSPGKMAVKWGCVCVCVVSLCWLHNHFCCMFCFILLISIVIVLVLCLLCGGT